MHDSKHIATYNSNRGGLRAEMPYSFLRAPLPSASPTRWQSQHLCKWARETGWVAGDLTEEDAELAEVGN